MGPTVVIARSAPVDPARIAHLLHRDELAALMRIGRPDDRARSATGRALLRLLVMRRTGRPAAAIGFTARCPTCGGPHGKPDYLPDPGMPPVHTSVSHVGDCVLVVAALVPVGVDVERTAAVGFDGFDAVALTAREQRQVAGLGAAERDLARARMWVRKEAVLKAHGVGLAVGPDGVEVGPAAAGRVVADPLCPGRKVALVPLSVPAGYTAALAVRSAELPVISDLDGPLLTAARAAPSPRASA